jgi:hypothetical protein
VRNIEELHQRTEETWRKRKKQRAMKGNKHRKKGMKQINERKNKNPNKKARRNKETQKEE